MPPYPYYHARRVAARHVDRWFALILLDDLSIEQSAPNARSTASRYEKPSEDISGRFTIRRRRSARNSFAVAPSRLPTRRKDRLPVRVDPDEHVLVAEIGRVGRLDPILILSDVGPKLVQFQAIDLDELHQPKCYSAQPSPTRTPRRMIVSR